MSRREVLLPQKVQALVRSCCFMRVPFAPLCSLALLPACWLASVLLSPYITPHHTPRYSLSHIPTLLTHYSHVASITPAVLLGFLRCVPSMPPHWLLPAEPSRYRTLESTDLPLLRSTCYCQQMHAVETEENAELRLLQQREDLVRTTTSTFRTTARYPQLLTSPHRCSPLRGRSVSVCAACVSCKP